ncbi:MAG: prohibitin family protein [Oscillospiraceae bacterium]
MAIVDVKSGKNPMSKIGKIILWVIIAIAVIILIASSFCTITAGHTGVITTFGKPASNVLGEGLHFKIPFIQQIIVVDNRVMKTDIDSSSASKDLQTVTSTISVNYCVNRENSVNIYKNVGLNYDEIIVKPAVQECVKAVTAKFTAEDLIGKRQEISAQMEELLAEKISEYGLDIKVFNIISFDFSEEFNKAIEAKQTAQQNALKAEQDLQRIKVEAQQKIEQAKAEAEAYRLKSQEITESMIRMEYINKWDGKLPTVVSDGTNIMDIGGLVTGSNQPAAATPAP